MTKRSLLIDDIRMELKKQGCKKNGHIDFILSCDKSIFVLLFTIAVGNKGRIETSIELRYRYLNEFSFYLSEYGTVYKGKMLKGPFSGSISIPDSLHVSGISSFGLLNSTRTMVYDQGDISRYVARCIEIASPLISDYQDIDCRLREDLDQNDASDNVIIISLFLQEYERARRKVREQREPDGAYLGLVPMQADRYLSDIGYPV